MACIEYPLCKYASYGEGGALLCNRDHPCTFQKYCTTLLKNIHTSAYKNCEEAKVLSGKKKNYAKPLDKEKEIKKEEIIEKKEEKPNQDIIEKSEICEARCEDGLIYINFKGYGLVCPIEEKKAKELEAKGLDKVKVYYEGEIGKPNFRFKV